MKLYFTFLHIENIASSSGNKDSLTQADKDPMLFSHKFPQNKI